MSKTKIGVLVSGGGTNLQAIIDACQNGCLAGIAEVALVISNKQDAYALERAKKYNIEGLFIDRKQFPDRLAFCEQMIQEIKKRNINFICLAGFLLKLEPNFVQAFKNRILNIHPALLPKYGGKGMYGHYVHEAVIAAGDKESGATVHIVDEEFDHGPTVLQRRVAVMPGDTPEVLAKRVLEVEHQIYPEAIKSIIEK